MKSNTTRIMTTIGRSRMIPVLLCTLLLSTSPAVAGDAGHRPMRFDQLTLDDGLSQSNVLSIWQDSRGLMWFGTENGLNSYNGYEFRRFTRERGNPLALGSDFIYDIAEDADGNLWLGTNGGGLAMMNRSTSQFTSFRHDPDDPNSISSNVVRALLLDTDGIVWLGTRGAGLDRFDPQSGMFTHYRFGSDAPHTKNPNDIYTIYKDSGGTLWLGSNRGLGRLDPESGELVSYLHNADDETAISDHRVRAILEDGDAHLWVGTYGGGLNRFDMESGTFERFQNRADDPSSIASDRVTTIFRDSDGRLWVGTAGGLNLFDDLSGSFTHYRNDATDASSLADNSVTSVFQDRGGILWVGTQNRGLSKWNPQTWLYGFEKAREISADGETPPNVTSFVEDTTGTLWVGTYGDGLNAMDRASGELTRYRHDPAAVNSISDNRVMSLMRDNEGMIWIGTMTGGVNRLNPETGAIDVFRHDAEDPHSLSANGIMAMYQDSGGLIWVGTFGGGVSRLDPESGLFTRFLADASSPVALSSNRITSFVEDLHGNIWIGTDAGGLNLFDPAASTFTQFLHDPDDPQSLSANTVYALNVDASGTVWVGTQGGGLDRVMGDASKPAQILFRNISQDDGLANNVVYGIQFDDSGGLWLSTNYGISRLDPKTGDIRNMHRSDGLQSEEFNFGAHYRSDSGELFFGGHNGFNAFDPAALQTNSAIPSIMLTGFYNGNELVKSDLPLDEETGIEITYKDDRVSFEFAALDYASPARNRYMYKLEGFDTHWLDLGNRRRVTYTDLGDGQYLLRVKAANSNGRWNEVGLSIPVRVSPAPWDTWWAYLGYVAMFVQLIVVLWLGHRRKIRREEEYSRRLRREVDKRTDQLLDRNKQLNTLNQSLQETSLSDPLTGLRNRRFVFEEISRDLEVIKRKAREEAEGIDPRKSADLVFMMIDVDNFKPINDTYGHAVGDRVLLQLRDVLLGTCRKSDFVIRWGGDEFVIIAKQANPGESEALAERIRTQIAEHKFDLGDGQEVRTTCSIGFAAYPLFRAQADDASLDQILGLADDLMYEAKRKRNAWAGMLGPSEAATSANFDLDSVEPTSLLFRARRAGKLTTFGDDAHKESPLWPEQHKGGSS